MKITEETIDHISNLARLNFEGDAKATIKADLERIVQFMAKLSEVPTDNVEPLIFMSDEVNVLRNDDAKTTISQTEALKNAPKKDSDYFRISKVLSK